MGNVKFLSIPLNPGQYVSDFETQVYHAEESLLTRAYEYLCKSSEKVSAKALVAWVSILHFDHKMKQSPSHLTFFKGSQ